MGENGLKSTGSPRWNFADPASHERLRELRDSLISPYDMLKGTSVDAQAMARGYAWGRIDSPGYTWPSHGGDGLDFAMAYAIHHLSDKCTHAIREAFEAWHKMGVIGS